MTNLNRIPPLGPPQAYKTYSLLAPLDSHWRDASCDEVNCLVSATGWRTVIEENTPLGERQAGYIRTQSGRHYTEMGRGMVVFTFPPGEECFTAHRVNAEREPIYVVRRGDYRGYDGGRQHANGTDWVEDFALHQDRLARSQ